eukprot:263156-Chlamydomonas_euryale.AAC.1
MQLLSGAAEGKIKQPAERAALVGALLALSESPCLHAPGGSGDGGGATAAMVCSLLAGMLKDEMNDDVKLRTERCVPLCAAVWHACARLLVSFTLNVTCTTRAAVWHACAHVLVSFTLNVTSTLRAAVWHACMRALARQLHTEHHLHNPCCCAALAPTDAVDCIFFHVSTPSATPSHRQTGKGVACSARAGVPDAVNSIPPHAFPPPATPSHKQTGN